MYDPFPSWSQGSDINKMDDSVVVEKLRLESWPDHYVALLRSGVNGDL